MYIHSFDLQKYKKLNQKAWAVIFFLYVNYYMRKKGFESLRGHKRHSERKFWGVYFISHRTDGAARAEDKFIWTMPSRDRGRRSQITEITEILACG